MEILDGAIVTKKKILVTRQAFPEIIDWLRERFEVEHNQETDEQWSQDEFRRRLAGMDGALTAGNDRVDAPLLDALPQLRAVCNMTVGFNNFNLADMTSRGVIATNTSGTLDETTADMAWALMLAAARRVTESERWLRAGHWKGWKNSQFLGQDVHGATLGIVGMGNIGRAVARRARGFSMKVIYNNRNRVSPEIERELGVSYMGLDELLAQSDFVSVHVPYYPEAHHLIDARRIALLKPTAIVVNTARGGIIDDAALIEALKAGRIAGAGLDVFEGEPAFNPGFTSLDNVALAPHIGSATRATRMRMWKLGADNLVSALAGERPPNLLNPDVWERRRR